MGPQSFFLLTIKTLFWDCYKTNERVVNWKQIIFRDLIIETLRVPVLLKQWCPSTCGDRHFQCGNKHKIFNFIFITFWAKQQFKWLSMLKMYCKCQFAIFSWNWKQDRNNILLFYFTKCGDNDAPVGTFVAILDKRWTPLYKGYNKKVYICDAKVSLHVRKLWRIDSWKCLLFRIS